MTAPTTPAPGKGRARLLGWAVLLVTFGSGLLVGWLASGPHGPGRRGGPPGPPREAFDRLHLTAGQRTAIDSIFAARRAQIDAFWDGPGQRLRAIIDSTRLDVRGVLDSSQRAEFDAMRPPGPPGRERHGPMEGPPGPGFPGGPHPEGPPPPPPGPEHGPPPPR